MDYPKAVDVLQQRLEFLEGIADIAKNCGWSYNDIVELHSYLLTEVIQIDNLMFGVFEQTKDPEMAYLVWEANMEDLRYWLGLILGVRIRFV